MNRKLVPGEPCSRGHPWHRSPDFKKCLTCYPPLPDATRDIQRQAARGLAEKRLVVRIALAEARIALEQANLARFRVRLDHLEGQPR